MGSSLNQAESAPPETQNKDHEDHIAESSIFLSDSELVQKPIPMLRAMRMPHAKGAVDKEEQAEESIFCEKNISINNRYTCTVTSVARIQR